MSLCPKYRQVKAEVSCSDFHVVTTWNSGSSGFSGSRSYLPNAAPRFGSYVGFFPSVQPISDSIPPGRIASKNRSPHSKICQSSFPPLFSLPAALTDLTLLIVGLCVLREMRSSRFVCGAARGMVDTSCSRNECRLVFYYGFLYAISVSFCAKSLVQRV